jgi:hypothetical protein
MAGAAGFRDSTPRYGGGWVDRGEDFMASMAVTAHRRYQKATLSQRSAVDVVHVGLISSGSRDLIFFDELRVDMAPGTSPGKIEGIDQGTGISFPLDIMASMAILTAGCLALPGSLRQPMNPPLIGVPWFRMTGGTPRRGKSFLPLNFMRSMAARTGRNGSMDALYQTLFRLFSVARFTYYGLHPSRMRNLGRFRMAILTRQVSMDRNGQLL